MMLYSLQDLPQGVRANKVDVTPGLHDGRPCLRLALDAVSRSGTYGVDYVDQPSFHLLPEVSRDATIEVDLCAWLLPDAPDFARGFIGLAYRVQDDLSSYESLYLRPTNGRLHAPPAARDARALQYYAYPDHPFDVLRDTDLGKFEAGADIALGRWTSFRIEIRDTEFAAYADGRLILSGQGKIPPR